MHLPGFPIPVHRRAKKSALCDLRPSPETESVAGASFPG
ncbi:hypothetical protein AGRO_1826 [Agrobacterium sp. ATCC 31749]|nr:hypothetical protein AGRO_1826 [Agrobacterium sp. ATCC 31749]